MTRQELLEILESWENLPVMMKLISKNEDTYDLLMDVALHHNSDKIWRAAYLVDKINDDYPELILPYMDKIIYQLKIEKNSSKKRHFLKLISMKSIPENHFGFLVNYCLETLSSEEPPAVRVHAMQVLFNISEKEQDLKPELILVIEHEMEYHSTAGILARGRKLAQKLRKQMQ